MLNQLKLLSVPLVTFCLFILATLSAFRLGFTLWQLDHFSNYQDIAMILTSGFRIDLSSIGYLLILPVLIHSVSQHLPRFNKYFRIIFMTYFVIVLSAIFLLELATPAFINEYGLRPNRLFIEYLIYPKEVFQMLVNGHWEMLVIVFTAIILISHFIIFPLAKKLANDSTLETKLSSLSKVSASILLFLISAIFARGTFDHRPINPSFVYFSTDPLVNSLTLNSSYSVAYAIKAIGNEKSAAKIYGKMDKDKVISIVRNETGLKTENFYNESKPTQAIRQPTYKGKPKNLVIILEESLGAQYVSELNGLELTPNIDKFYNEGWGFKQLYATGTRSVRGVEAVITGFTPTPARAVVKLDKSQKNFFTIANLLKDNGYNTQFIYGGESHFDNMKSFFLGNGFTDIVDFDDIEEPTFVGSWGASDEDLFKQTDKELLKLHKQGKSFFSFIFSSSNHDPFEIPEDVITPISYSQEQLSEYNSKELLRHKAIQYADYALGKFIDKAKSQPYWQDTVFLIVADHDARVMGKNLVPINNFHIPAVILNSTHLPAKDDRIVSQIDLAPTVLSLIGVANDSPMIGQDLTNENINQRAMMQYASNFAYLTGAGATILRPNKPALGFSYVPTSKSLLPRHSSVQEIDIALAHALWGSMAFQNNWFSYKTD
ncbi:MAG: LTA synthase family protein [Cognaticolwellia aestuarii]